MSLFGDKRLLGVTKETVEARATRCDRTPEHQRLRDRLAGKLRESRAFHPNSQIRRIGHYTVLIVAGVPCIVLIKALFGTRINTAEFVDAGVTLVLISLMFEFIVCLDAVKRARLARKLVPYEPNARRHRRA